MIRALVVLALLAGCQAAPADAPAPDRVAEPSVASNPALTEQAPSAAPALEVGERPEVVVYVTSWCPYCRQAREYLAAEDIPHRVVDIEASRAGAREYAERGGTGGIPLVAVGAETIEGWSAEATRELLVAAGYN